MSAAGVAPASLSRADRAAPPAPASRLAWLMLLLPALALAAALGRGLLADLYQGFGARHRATAPANERFARAAELAAMLAPWKVAALRDHASSQSARGATDAGALGIDRALVLAPADAALWLDRSRQLMRRGRFDDELVATMEQALRLAPQSRAVHFVFAYDGARFWGHGDARLQALWLESMRRTLRVQGRAFLRQLALVRREALFCGWVGAELRMTTWCERAASFRAACDASGLTEQQRRGCASIGLLPPRP